MRFTCKPCPGGKHVKFSDDLIPFLVTNESKDNVSGRNVLFNRETFDVTIAPKYAPDWVVFQNATNDLIDGSAVLRPGESV
eukprot:CAMPEP_0183711324 /NCGR_PEP_ID=MMETSP0737-20130205/6856_1 /TAXON_ID=385413 /ORGANISM="Thalassiosira miniscula, Strain CCMP1093" /LENGTH=80 /DNA_ID=CAMNT_0025939803 /DNA_START=5 /DNA_END=244 /DNA_ORIENTATION=+